MSARSGSGRRAMAAAALVRMPPDLAAAAQAAATADHLSMAAWLRFLAIDHLAGVSADARPSRPRRSLPPGDVIAVAQLREAVAEAVGGLVRSAAFNRQSGDPASIGAELEVLIPKFREAAFALDTLKSRLLP